MAYFQWLRPNLKAIVCFSSAWRPFYGHSIWGCSKTQPEKGKEWRREKEKKEKKDGRKKKGRRTAVMNISPVKLFKNTNSTNSESPRIEFLKTPQGILKLPATCREFWHSVPNCVPGKLERGVQVSSWQQKGLWTFKVCIKHPCECFF